MKSQRYTSYSTNTTQNTAVTKHTLRVMFNLCCIDTEELQLRLTSLFSHIIIFFFTLICFDLFVDIYILNILTADFILMCFNIFLFWLIDY